MMALLSPVVWRAIAVAVALAALTGVYSVWVKVQRNVGRAEVRAEWQADKLAMAEVNRLRELANRKTEQDYAKGVTGALNAAKKREQVARDAADGARTELDGLRRDSNAFATGPGDVSSDTLAACRRRTATVNELFNQCAGAYQGMAEKADRHASDTMMLEQAWPKD